MKRANLVKQTVLDTLVSLILILLIAQIFQNALTLINCFQWNTNWL